MIIAARDTTRVSVDIHPSVSDANIQGRRPFTVKVTTKVVIKVLSAAGSSMVPRTDRILNLRAKYPSIFPPSYFRITPIEPLQTKGRTKSEAPAYTSNPVAR